ncbi:MAG: hypothetical protein ABI600_01935 [Luteolibacter sp.]
MTADNVRDRFVEMGWEISSNTIMTYAQDILKKASLEIDTKVEALDILRDQVIGFSMNVEDLHCRLSRHLTTLFKGTVLRRFIQDYETVSAELAEDLIRKIGESSPMLQSWTNEHENIYLAYLNFLPYVCNNQSYEKFMKFSHLTQRLFLGRVDTVVYYLTDLGNGDLFAGVKAPIIAENLVKLKSLFNGKDDALKSIQRLMLECAKALRGEKPDIAGAKTKACEALHLLEPYRDRWRVFFLIRLNPIADIKNALEARVVRNEPLPHDNSIEAERLETPPLNNLAQEIVAHLETMTIAVSQASLDHAPGKLLKCAGDCAEALQLFAEQLSQATESQYEDRLIERLDRLKTGIEEIIRSGKVCNKTHHENLSDLLADLTAYSGTRKFRPYPLFLYAAQNGILKDKLIEKRCEPKSDADYAPKHESPDSILWSYTEMLDGKYYVNGEVSETSTRTPF